MTGETAGDGTAVLVLEDGRIFRGEPYGAVGESLGEAVFTTGMTGYQETLTDPSYHRQIVLQTAPQIGNTGWNGEDDESARIQVAGYVVRDPARTPSNWRATGSLGDALRAQGVVGVAGIDTRAAVRHLREHGAMRAGVFSGPSLAGGVSDDVLVDRVRQSPPMEGADLYGAVTTAEPYIVPAVGERRFVVAALDVGIKYNTPRMLAARGVEVHVLPADTPIEKIDELRPDGFFLANGPGDPATADGPVALTKQVLERRIPLFGICFGNQILGRALGRGTYKLRYGHRGINIPVIEHATGRVAITSQNHGFAVQGDAGERFRTPYGSAVITHTCPNDGCVEGLAGEDFPAFSVQYHPEAAAGPHDAADLFDRFVQLMVDNPVGYAGAAGIPLPGATVPDAAQQPDIAQPEPARPDLPQHVPSPPSVEDAETSALPVQAPSPASGEPETSALPVVPRSGPGEPDPLDPLTAPFSDVEDSIGRREPQAEVRPEPQADPPPDTRRSGPVSDRPWPPPAGSGPSSDVESGEEGR
ncbi:carbamoyl-phosphate synthase small subunit [Pseudonocardia endophytica]|uniref:Carbamoyl phosphate synthase small chain n=1 Tax=Pseudonocardia endophytica TaxID=401976 RepID=A0A4R1HNI1_PSEEN|nr:carbamoyl-phosphate synthase small subunit [Pseudonocardia endophytica]